MFGRDFFHRTERIIFHNAEGTFFSKSESRIFSGRMVNTGRAFVYWNHQKYAKKGSDA
jgi:hypothetical protein